MYDIVLLLIMELKELFWDDFNSKHILKHGVNKTEVEQACKKQKLVLRVRDNRLLLIGKTKDKRILSIVLAKVFETKYYVVTARDSSRKENILIKE